MLCQYPTRQDSTWKCFHCTPDLCLNITGEVSPSSVWLEEDALCHFPLLLGYWQSTSPWILQLCPNIKDVQEDALCLFSSLAGCAQLYVNDRLHNRAGATSPVGQVSTGPLFSPSALTADVGDYDVPRINRRTKYGKY